MRAKHRSSGEGGWRGEELNVRQARRCSGVFKLHMLGMQGSELHGAGTECRTSEQTLTHRCWSWKHGCEPVVVEPPCPRERGWTFRLCHKPCVLVDASSGCCSGRPTLTPASGECGQQQPQQTLSSATHRTSVAMQSMESSAGTCREAFMLLLTRSRKQLLRLSTPCTGSWLHTKWLLGDFAPLSHLNTVTGRPNQNVINVVTGLTYLLLELALKRGREAAPLSDVLGTTFVHP
jgi:hypothetical protein